MTDPTTTPPRVFLICEPSVKKARTVGGGLPNITPLFEHGNVTVLLTSADPRPINHPEQALQLIDQRLDTYHPDHDLLAWAGGDTIAALLTGVALERRGVNAVTWLRYDRAIAPDGSRTDDGARYTPVRVTLFTETDDDGRDDEPARTRTTGAQGA